MIVPIEIPIGAYRNGTEYQAKGRWRDVDKVRWYEGQMRPADAWGPAGGQADIDGVDFISGAMAWQDYSGNKWIIFGSFDRLFVMDEDDFVVVDIEGSALNGSKNPVGSVEASVWHFSTFGEIPLGMLTEDGTIYEWDLNTGNNVTAVNNAPTSNDGMFVTPERFVVALGAGGDTRKVEWSDRESRTVWAPASTNQAGGFTLDGGGRMRFGLPMRGESLIVTESDAWRLRYVGYPDVYEFGRVGECSCISSRGGIVVDDAAFWIGENRFFAYRGGYLSEIDCDVQDHVFSDIGTATKTYAFHRKAFNEVIWLYSSTQTTAVDSYVSYNYRDDIWAYGHMPFSAAVDEGVLTHPVAFRYESASVSVTNGTFAADSDWTKGTNWQIAGGVANQTSFAVSSIEQDISGLTVGKSYVVKFDTLNHTAGNLQVIFDGASSSGGSSSDTHYVTYVATATTMTLEFQAVNSFDGDLDNVEIQEAPINALYPVPVADSRTHDGDTPHATTGPLEIGDGERRVHVTRIYPDEQDQGELQYTFSHREYPTASETTESAVTAANPTDVRFSGRQFTMKVEPVTASSDWRCGITRLEIHHGGKR